MVDQALQVDPERLRAIFARGLRQGPGTDARGPVCLEQAISLATGGPLVDRPACVEEADRAYGIAINDACWSSPEARAEALFPLALAQGGTAGEDRGPWARRLAEGIIRKVLPEALRTVATCVPKVGETLRAAADRCEVEGSEAAARAAEAAAEAAARAAAGAAAWAAAEAARAAAEAAALAADAAGAAAVAAAAAAGAAAGAAAEAAGAAAAVAAAAAGAAARAARAAGAAAEAAERDRILRLSVAVALEAYAAEGREPVLDSAYLEAAAGLARRALGEDRPS